MKQYSTKQSLLMSFVILLCSLSLFSFYSCDKEDVDSNDLTPNDSYYVKYVISSTYPRVFSNWSVTTPEGVYTKNGYQTRGWEETYGPVKKGFKCDAKVGNGEATVRIYVSKNQEPFALKTTKTNFATYTIDF